MSYGLLSCIISSTQKDYSFFCFITCKFCATLKQQQNCHKNSHEQDKTKIAAYFVSHHQVCGPKVSSRFKSFHRSSQIFPMSVTNDGSFSVSIYTSDPWWSGITSTSKKKKNKKKTKRFRNIQPPKSFRTGVILEETKKKKKETPNRARLEIAFSRRASRAALPRTGCVTRVNFSHRCRRIVPGNGGTWPV